MKGDCVRSKQAKPPKLCEHTVRGDQIPFCSQEGGITFPISFSYSDFLKGLLLIEISCSLLLLTAYIYSPHGPTCIL